MSDGDIILIDDDPTQRLVAYRDLKKITTRLIVPETVSHLLTGVDPDTIGLVIVDRWLGESWHAAADEFLRRVPESVTVWEWTCDEWGTPLNARVQRVIYKRPGLLLSAVQEWVEA